ncbi:hypothetical protein GCM10028803_25030 [Larkinella knui]|uniref:Uncharacterized protein n=1 Tax=Larkinella knui TaxID=2025310 RepID=A0A3P1CWU8_9BACT|nr:hypothetical protein [Larkinella knui]RRB17560.1 hypothetical protein EHT87_04550 [Larkinella knui]
MEKMFVVRVVGVDDLGAETPATIPMKFETSPDAALIEQDLNEQYPHLKHRVVEIEELKTPGEVDNWHHSFLGSVMGTDLPAVEEEKDAEN